MRLLLFIVFVLLRSTHEVHADDIPGDNLQSTNACGWSSPPGTPLAIERPSIRIGEFPWLVAIFRAFFLSPELAVTHDDYIGAGTIIHPSVVVTVAHIVTRRTPDELICRAGDWNLEREWDVILHQDKGVRKIAIHDQLNRTYAYNDVALLFLESPFTLNSTNYVDVACLARDTPAPGTLCYALGPKHLEDLTVSLKKTEVSLVDHEECQHRLRRTRYGPKYFLHHSLTCIGDDPEVNFLCYADRGSPLMCPLDTSSVYRSRYVVYGMAAYGDCHRAAPPVFTTLPSLMNWIDREMEAEKLDISTYASET